MIRKVSIYLLLSIFVVATTGVILHECCCGTSIQEKVHSCCDSKSSCKSHITLKKITDSYNSNQTKQIKSTSIISFYCSFILSDLNNYSQFSVLLHHKPPTRLGLISTEFLQIFRL